MDPYTSTREQFTANITSRPIPANAHADWKAMAETHQALLDKLSHHEAMAPNLQQTYMTPANSKNKIYFMWDFVGRTLGYLYAIPSDGNLRRGPQREVWSDVVSRASLTKTLLNPNEQTMLEEMVEMTYPDQRGQHPPLGDEVVEAGRALP